ncbi:MAG: precorrin-4 C(11)-methyltransferase [Rhodospirillaceae bacterium]|nr:MAG: precorrin-4 C(11)-methyltransferase [Rhodospirillaceae bacterium]
MVHFIGAGPGDPELITVKGKRLIEEAPVVLYAGSLVPPGIVALARPDALVIDTAPLHLDEIIAHIRQAIEAGKMVARVHSGDPSIYGATAEQMRRLDELGIAYDVTPGVPAFAAAAAALKSELTLPEISQTIIITRTDGEASPMPEGEDLATLGKSGATLAIHLSIRNIHKVVAELTPHYGEDCPVIIAFRVGWPDQEIVRGTLADIKAKVKAMKVTRTALIFVGHVLGRRDFNDSRLYHVDHQHVLRPGKKKAAG